jgi:hypothetical protein
MTIFAKSFGTFPLRQDITVYPADPTNSRKLGWIVKEEIGIGIINPRLFDKRIRIDKSNDNDIEIPDDSEIDPNIFI